MINTSYYTEWEDYKKEHPEIADDGLKADKIQNYEDAMFRFIMMLFM